MKHNAGFSKLFRYRQKIFIPKQFQMKFYKWTVSYLQYTKSNKLITLSVASLFLVKLIITISSVTQTEVEVTFFTIHSTSTYVTIWTYFFLPHSSKSLMLSYWIYPTGMVVGYFLFSVVASSNICFEGLPTVLWTVPTVVRPEPMNIVHCNKF